MAEFNHEIIFGKHAVEELLKSGKPISKVFIHNKLSGVYEVMIRQLCKDQELPLVRTEIESLNKLSGGRNHQGIVAASSPIEFQKLENIVPFLFEQDQLPLLLVLDHIKDVRNFGAIVRSAEVFGAHGVIIPKKNSAAINNDAVKTSSGALLNMPVCRVSDLKSTLGMLQDSGIQVFASDVRSEKNITEIDLNVPAAIILGAEGKGVQKELINQSNQSFKIPQVGTTDSLNVSVSAGIILYETLRQRH